MISDRQHDKVKAGVIRNNENSVDKKENNNECINRVEHASQHGADDKFNADEPSRRSTRIRRDPTWFRNNALSRP